MTKINCIYFICFMLGFLAASILALIDTILNGGK